MHPSSFICLCHYLDQLKNGLNISESFFDNFYSNELLMSEIDNSAQFYSEINQIKTNKIIRRIGDIQTSNPYNFIQDRNGDFKSEVSLTFKLLRDKLNSIDHNNMSVEETISNAYKAWKHEPDQTAFNIQKNKEDALYLYALSGEKFYLSDPSGLLSQYQVNCEHLQFSPLPIEGTDRFKINLIDIAKNNTFELDANPVNWASALSNEAKIICVSHAALNS